MTDTIVACIITYNPDLARLTENINAVSGQVSHVIVVDNGSDNFDAINAKLADCRSVILHASKENRGIAWALNKAFSIAANENAAWVLTLDQDSVCPADMVEKYSSYLAKISRRMPAERINKIGILCPTVVDRNAGLLEGGAEHTETVRKCITSGSFTSYAVWKSVGGFDEKMFIDGVDFEYCERLWKNGYYIIRVAGVTLLHELGQMTTHRLLFRTVRVKNHSALRKYYIVRNRFYVAHKYKKPFSVAGAYLSAIKAMAVTLLFEDDKKNKIKAIQKGIKEGSCM